ncbi:MAG: YqhA family protein [Acidithiobacillus sp.]|nr:YqhA family protein [Acidithiobacillus sp.]
MWKKLESGFEFLLWNSRLVVLFAVIASLLVALAVFYMTSVDAWHLLQEIFLYGNPSLDDHALEALHAKAVAHAVSIVDGYLLATILLIFAMGLYELFISKIDIANDARSSRVLFIRSLDDLKDRLGKVILLILVVSFFERSLAMQVENFTQLLFLAIGIALVAVALYLTHRGGGHHRLQEEDDEHHN